MIIKQLSVFLEDKIGRLTEMTKILADNDINISAFNIAEAADYGIARFIVDDPKLALKVLKENRFSVNITDVVGMVVPHDPGALYKALQILSANNITIDYMYAFAIENAASVIIRSSSNDDVIRVLQENKLSLLKVSDIYKI
ncbi:MAG: acetolactate synthase [Bacteroidales bacterium]|nr:acetolactate synthase [Bacteroidales bacterium]